MARSIKFCTGNKNKVREVQQILGGLIDLTPTDIHLAEVQGEALDIARSKCDSAYRQFNSAVLVEDTSLGFNALRGLPGPYVSETCYLLLLATLLATWLATWLATSLATCSTLLSTLLGSHSFSLSYLSTLLTSLSSLFVLPLFDIACLAALHSKCFLAKMGVANLPRLLADFEDKSAVARCVFAYCDETTPSPLLFEGITEGSIVAEPRGPQNFGWDPIFVPDGFEQTYAEMESSVKNSISHRYRALEKLKAHLTAHTTTS
eukprot:GHVS01058477.1.p1 GENE.GHVS01058477.1~~GHVS01058477.1.p1  ORF type:complete len:262 (+),score=27.64 GHVS01058477.1:180-965(+)